MTSKEEIYLHDFSKRLSIVLHFINDEVSR